MMEKHLKILQKKMASQIMMLGKKKEFWKRTHLFYELRPGINITSIPELGTITNSSNQHGLGLRVTWN